MKVRVLTGAALAAVLVPVLIFSEYIVYPIVLSILSLFAVFEMLRVLGVERRYMISVPAYLMALAAPFGAFYHESFNDGAMGYILVVMLAFVAYLLYLFAYSVLSRMNIKFSEVATAFTTTLYIVLCFSAFTLLRYMEKGAYLFVIVIISSCVCDIFAYFTGFLFGKHKLIPEISPKKTVEGAIGGTVFATLALVLYGFILDKTTEAVDVNYLLLTIYGVVLAVVGQFGDLAASLIKREHGVKDYGRLLPGHGGVLDRVDSLLPIAFVLCILLLVFPPVF